MCIWTCIPAWLNSLHSSNQKGKKSIKSNQQSNYTVSLKEWGSLVGFLHNNKQDFKLFLFELLMGNKGENILV